MFYLKNKNEKRSLHEIYLNEDAKVLSFPATFIYVTFTWNLKIHGIALF